MQKSTTKPNQRDQDKRLRLLRAGELPIVSSKAAARIIGRSLSGKILALRNSLHFKDRRPVGLAFLHDGEGVAGKFMGLSDAYRVLSCTEALRGHPAAAQELRIEADARHVREFRDAAENKLLDEVSDGARMLMGVRIPSARNARLAAAIMGDALDRRRERFGHRHHEPAAQAAPTRAPRQHSRSFVAVAHHEAGHALVVRLLGQKIVKVQAGDKGGAVVWDNVGASAIGKAMISLAGLAAQKAALGRHAAYDHSYREDTDHRDARQAFLDAVPFGAGQDRREAAFRDVAKCVDELTHDPSGRRAISEVVAALSSSPTGEVDGAEAARLIDRGLGNDAPRLLRRVLGTLRATQP